MLRTIFILFFLFQTHFIVAQAPQHLNYQAVARDSLGVPMGSRDISIEVIILQESVTGTEVYNEINEITTNKIGLFTLAIGAGDPDRFAAIKWGENKHFIKIMLDPDGGADGWMDFGTTELLSVPYALFANQANSSDELSLIGKNNGDVLKWRGDSLKWVSASDSVIDADNDPENEIQFLSLNTNTISLSNGGSVTLPLELFRDDDSDPNNEIQTLYLVDNVIYLTRGDSVILPKSLFEDQDLDPSNELQSLALVDNTITLTQGGSVTLPVELFEDDDADPENELQILSLKDDTIFLSNGGFVPDIFDNLGDHLLTQNISTEQNWISGDGDDEGIYIDAQGNVGLGESSPKSSLDVGGGVAIKGQEVIDENGNWIGGFTTAVGVPSGIITMWSGSLESIPEGWALCDGSNNTPDLKGRFVVGYDPNNADYSEVGNQGGTEDVVLSIDQMPSHSHGNRVYSSSENRTDAMNTYPAGRNFAAQAYRGLRNSTTNHTNTNEIVSTGGGQAHENRPPYYVLAFIIKL